MKTGKQKEVAPEVKEEVGKYSSDLRDTLIALGKGEPVSDEPHEPLWVGEKPSGPVEDATDEYLEIMHKRWTPEFLRKWNIWEWAQDALNVMKHPHLSGEERRRFADAVVAEDREAIVRELTRFGYGPADAKEGAGVLLDGAREKFPLVVATAEAATESPARPDMPEGVLDGRLGEIHQKRLRRFPIAYAWPALLALGGALIPTEEPIANHGPLFNNRSPFRPTLYTALMGPVASGKSQAIEQAAAALGVGSPILCDMKAGSAEGLAPMLDASGAPRVLCPDELGHLLDKAKIEGASFPRVLNTLYYHTHEQLVIAKGKTVAFNCRLSVIGGVVEEDFANVFGASTIHGLYSRMIFGLCPEPWQYLYRPPEEAAEETHPTPVAVDSDVWDARDEWVNKHGIHPRDAENTLRVAYICACFDGRNLRAKDLGPAFEFAKTQSLFRSVYSPTQGPTLDAQGGDRIMRTLTAHGTGWVTLRWLNQRIHGSRDFGPAVFNRCVQNLAFGGEVEFVTEGRAKRLRLSPEDKV